MFWRSRILILAFFLFQFINAQRTANLDFFIAQALANAPALSENENLQKIGALQESIIKAQQNSFQVNATSDVLFAPYFNNNGRVISTSIAPSSSAYGYDVGITNGGLYSAQINVTKQLFNKAATANLLFQNKIKNNTLSLSAQEVEHNLKKTISDAYVTAYQLQLQEQFTQEILKDLQNRLQVIEVLVKHAILQESDYLLLQLDIDSKKLELKQIQSNLRVALNQVFTLSGITSQAHIIISEPHFNTPSSAKKENFYLRKFKNDSLQIKADEAVFDNAYKPQITAYGNTGLNAVEIPNITHKIGMSAGLQISIPIYDGKQRKFTHQQNLLKEQNLEFYKTNAAVQLTNNLQSITNQLDALSENKLLLDNQLKKQQSILEIYKGKLVQGQISIVDYLNVIQSYKLNKYTQIQMQTNIWLLQNQYNFINW